MGCQPPAAARAGRTSRRASAASWTTLGTLDPPIHQPNQPPCPCQPRGHVQPLTLHPRPAHLPSPTLPHLVCDDGAFLSPPPPRPRLPCVPLMRPPRGLKPHGCMHDGGGGGAGCREAPIQGAPQPAALPSLLLASGGTVPSLAATLPTYPASLHPTLQQRRGQPMQQL